MGLFGFLKGSIDTGISVIKTPISLTEDALSGDGDFSSTTESLEELEENIESTAEEGLDIFDW